jgi:KaiC/GvpD/RAD55 family RecA-like ATPase
MRKQSNVPAFNSDSVLEYERACLGCYLSGAAIGERISADVFYDSRNREAFRAIAALLADGVLPDLLAVKNLLLERGKLEEAGGAAYIAGLTDAVATAANKGFYEGQLLKAWRRRVWETAQSEAGNTPDYDESWRILQRAREKITAEAGDGEFAFGSDLDDGGDIEPADYLVAGLIARGARAMVFGASGDGKTLATIGLACSVAAGTPFLGHTAKQGAVWYLSQEGRKGLRTRARGWQTVNSVKIPRGALLLNGRPVNLQDPESVKWLCGAVKAAKQKPDLLVFDTWAESLGADDSDTAAARAGEAALSEIQSCGDFAVLLIHHTGHGNKERARGASSLFATLDHCYRLDKSPDGTRVLVSVKQKDQEPTAPIAFKINPVSFRQKNGWISTVWCEPCGLPEAQPKLGKNEASLLDGLKAAGEGGLSQEEWREACPGTDRRIFSRAKNGLLEKKLAAFDGSVYRACHQGGVITSTHLKVCVDGDDTHTPARPPSPQTQMMTGDDAMTLSEKAGAA